MAAKKAQRTVKEMQDAMKQSKKEEVAARRERRLEKARRRAEGEMRAAQVQVLDPAKLKKMNKKQLRGVKKTRVNAQTGVVEFVGAYQ